MTKEQYLALKEELKSLANQIKSSKSEFKADQRDFSLFEKIYGARNHYFKGRMTSGKWESIQKDWSKKYDKQEESNARLFRMKRDYRHKHIVYSFARGKTMKQIEPKVGNKNKPSYLAMPNMQELQRLMKHYDVKEPLELEVSR